MAFFLQGHPPHDNTTRRWHWAKRSREMRAWRDASAWAAREAYGRSTMGGAMKPVRISVTFQYRVRRTRDRANLVASLKPVLDGLVDAGILKDDGPLWLPQPPLVAEFVDPVAKVGILVKVVEL
jgi:Holliday junction resolvase RusA-like endonuclease